MPPPPRVWQKQQAFLASATLSVCVKHINITPEEFRFFFAARFSGTDSGTWQISVTAVAKSSLQLGATIQYLGSLHEWKIGVIHVERTNNPGQIIKLQFSRPDYDDSLLQLVPLRQLVWQPHQTTSWAEISIGHNEMPDIYWYGPVMVEHVGYFAPQPTEQVSENSEAIFIRFDHPTQVLTISQAEYFAIVGPSNPIR